MSKLNETISKMEAWIDDQNAMDTEIDACLVADALELLKEKQPRIYERSELQPFENTESAVWFEGKGFNKILPALIMKIYEPYYAMFMIVENGNEESFSWTMDLYMKRWRCWTARPTDEQRKAVPWKDGDGE